MADRYFMGLDYGTQSLRCGIFDERGNVAALSEIGYDTFYPQPGRAEQRPLDWVNTTHAVVESCYEQAGSRVFDLVSGISICSTSSTVIAIGHDDKPIGNGILWMDVRAIEQMQRINETKHEVLKHCGKEESAEWLTPKMMWLRDNEPQTFENSKLIVEFQDFINHFFTGRWCGALGQATCKSNYVEEMGGFNKDFFGKIGFDEFFEKANLDLVKQSDAIGSLRLDLAQKYHLKSDVLVFQGCLDAYTNMLGIGVCRPWDYGISLGSSFVHLAIVEHPVFINGIWGPYKDVPIPGCYCLEGGQISAASITKWFLREFDKRGELTYESMIEEALKIPIGSDGLLCLDFFQGNRTPYKDPLAKGVFYGLTLSHTRGHIYRSIQEGVTFGTKNVLDTIESGTQPFREIRACGGVTQNKLWLQIISDVTNRAISLTKNSDKAGILGCAITAAVGLGVYKDFSEACDNMVETTKIIEPSNEAHKEYDEFYSKYTTLYEQLKDIMHN